MDSLALFGLFAVTAMLVCYMREDLVRLGICRRVHLGFGIRVPPRGLAVRNRGRNLAGRRCAALVAGEHQKFTARQLTDCFEMTRGRTRPSDQGES
jgi:hypothetical protein